MRKPLYPFLILLISAVVGLNLQAQNVIKGTVKDAVEGVALREAGLLRFCESDAY